MVIKAERKKINNKELKKIISLFKEKLRQEQVPFQKVMLFGSYANGKAHIDSDIDLAVILPSKAPSVLKKKINNITWWAKQINVKLEPHFLSVSDLKNNFFSLPAEINKR
ncbi:nucleotidyltransferase domain-containing protein, partial [Candidatus Parcubacteria bacterium]|nr:nucleotidyltransferase domain-containing protein [Candidatus Parcubacteria bacterium]